MALMTSKKPQTRTRTIGSQLVVAFRATTVPLVWQFDLEKNHSFALVIQGRESAWDFGVIDLKGDFHPVARFNDYADAEDALNAMERSLMKRRVHSRWRYLGWVLAIIILVFALMTGMSSINSTVERSTNLTSATSTAAPDKMQNGVPVTADDVLKPPAQ